MLISLNIVEVMFTVTVLLPTVSVEYEFDVKTPIDVKIEVKVVAVWLMTDGIAATESKMMQTNRIVANRKNAAPLKRMQEGAAYGLKTLQFYGSHFELRSTTCPLLRLWFPQPQQVFCLSTLDEVEYNCKSA